MRNLYLLLFTFFIHGIAAAQLTGTKNIPLHYPDLATAITALNTQGVGAGGVILNIEAGNPQTAPLGGYIIGGSGTAILTTASSSNPVLIRGNSNTITAANTQTSGALNDGIIKIVGADWVTISGFILNENPANMNTTVGTNDMTEWGVALLAQTSANGCQNITIEGNTIALNRTYQNTFGIYANSTHSPFTIGTTINPTNPTGAHSGLKIYNNNVSNVNNGIVVIGSHNSAANMNDGLDIGGSTPAQGNIITDFGTNGTFSAYANVPTGNVQGIVVRNVKNFNISYNTIASSNGGTTSGTLRGISVPAFGVAPSGTINNTVSYNGISMRSAVPNGVIYGIAFEGTTGNATTRLAINNNNFHTSGHTVPASGNIAFLTHVAAIFDLTISNNTFANLDVNTTGTVSFINCSATKPANSFCNVNNNAIVGAFTKTGAGNSLQFFLSNQDSPASVTETNSGNNFSNITVTGATSIIGWLNTDGPASGAGPAKTITNNIFSNITGGTGFITALNVSFSSNANVSGNIISTVSGSGAVTGIVTSAGTQSFHQNTIQGLSSSGSGAVTVFDVSGGVTQKIYRNKIYDISGTNAGSTVNGILVSTVPASTVIYNNLIGDLKAPVASGTDVIRGISITGSTPSTSLDVSFNTIYLNASSSGTDFGTSGIFHATSATATTSALTLRNNIVVNTSTPNGSGLTVALRRSDNTLANYSSASNNNLVYIGTPSATNLVFFDGINADQQVADFKTRVAPAESATVAENPPFFSTIGSAPGFLHLNPLVATLAKDGGIPVSGISNDFDGETRDVTTPDIGADESSNSILPVTLLTFSGQRIGNANQLKWTVAQEIDVQNYQVERSEDGRNWSKAAAVASLGNTSSQRDYGFIDNNISGPKQLYRLRIVDRNLSAKLSSIVIITGEKGKVLALNGLFPNPATTQVSLLLNTPAKDNVSIVVVDAVGRVVKTCKATIDAGSNTLNVNLTGLSKGLHMVKVTSESSSASAITGFIKD